MSIIMNMSVPICRNSETVCFERLPQNLQLALRAWRPLSPLVQENRILVQCPILAKHDCDRAYGFPIGTGNPTIEMEVGV